MIGDYLDFQAAIGITKHVGGRGATRELLELCHVDEAGEVLEIGCGIGAGVAALVREHGCRAVGVDRSQEMLEWAWRRVREHGVADRVALRVADATALPFEDGRFDVVYAESVLGFIADQRAALAEMRRVTRPGGWMGINETVWTEPLSPEQAGYAASLGVVTRGPAEWRALCADAGWQDLEVRLRRVDPAAEVRNRLRWVGLSWAVQAWIRAARLYLTEPEVRGEIRDMFGTGMQVFEHTGYGLFAGRAPG